MPSQYSGQGDLPSRPVAVSIASSTNATPIVITTSGAHNLFESDVVLVSGHAGNTAANGLWSAHVLSSTTLSLLSPGTRTPSTGNGIGGATGSVQGQGLLPTFAEPSDTDAATAASVNVPFSALGDRASWLAQRIGSHKIVGSVITGPFDTAEPPGDLVAYPTPNPAYANATSVATLSANLIPGDIVIVRGMVGIRVAAGTTTLYLKTQRNLGAGAADFTGATRLVYSFSNAGGNQYTMLPLFCSETIAANVSVASSFGWNLVVTAYTASGGTTIAISNNSWFEIVALRPN